jgi:SAM-dependent methyltransferase
MHPSAYDNCLKFFNKYLSTLLLESLKVVDFGSYDVNGTLKPIFSKCNYIGIDMSPGPNVDIVTSGDNTPFETNSIDVVISSSNFEHDDCFWMTFLEMARIVKPGGFIYINAPSAGFYHGYPGDCWRFYADSGKALAKWANKNNINIELLETYIDTRGVWHDNVSIYRKDK